jgi:hypothetical protein
MGHPSLGTKTDFKTGFKTGLDGAAKPARGQVRHGHTLPIIGIERQAVLFMAPEAF